MKRKERTRFDELLERVLETLPRKLHDLLEEFRKVPDEWKEVAIAHVELVAQMAQRPPVRFIGDDPPDLEAPPDDQDEEQAA